MFDLRRARTRKVSVRSMIAVAGVAAATFGLAQVTGTMANPTDAVTTTGSQVATGNFYPTPPVKGLYCHVKFISSQNQAHVDWTKPDGPGPYSYKWEIYKNNKTTLVDSGVTTNTYKENRANTLPSNDWFYLRVKTINNGVESSGWQGVEIKRISGIQASCGGEARWDQNNEPWENITTWHPSTPAPVGNPLARGGGDYQAQRMAPQMEVTEDAEADKSTTPEAPTSTTEAPTTTNEVPNSTPSTSPTTPTTMPPGTITTSPTTTTPTPTPTADPKPELSDTATSGGLTAGWLPGGNKVAVVDAEGNELASGRAEKGSALHWLNGQLWIVGDTEVYRIMESPQDGTWKFYKDSGQNMPDFG